jgi:hypothetical protein
MSTYYLEVNEYNVITCVNSGRNKSDEPHTFINIDKHGTGMLEITAPNRNMAAKYSQMHVDIHKKRNRGKNSI